MRAGLFGIALLLSAIAGANEKKSCADQLDQFLNQLRAEIGDENVVIPDVVDDVSPDPWVERDQTAAAARTKIETMTRHQVAEWGADLRGMVVLLELSARGWAAVGGGEMPSPIERDAMHATRRGSNHPEISHESSEDFERLMATVSRVRPASEH